MDISHRFGKNERSNIPQEVLCAWKMIAQDLISCTDEALESLHNHGELEKIGYE